MTNWYISSTGNGLALRIRGLLVLVAPLLIMWLNSQGFNLSENEVMEIFDRIVDIAAQITAIIGAIMVVYGQLRAWWLRWQGRHIDQNKTK